MLVEGKIRSLSVVVPIFNEEAVIRESLTMLAEVLASLCAGYEILVIDDGSTDGTAAILDGLAPQIPGLKILRLARNQGLGTALRHGFQNASGEIVFYIDADMPFQYGEVLRAVKVLDESRADGVAGYRTNRHEEPLVRRLCSRIYNGCVRLLYGIRMRDVNCAFKLMRRESLRKLDLKAKGSFIDAEWMARSARQGYTIKEMGVEYQPRRESGSRLFRAGPILKAFGEMVLLYPEVRRAGEVPTRTDRVCR
ncbi:MAG: glycosyltransferase family 2 protein [Candidatus Omnitrophica bacterium]|nr:glycosyltransferase family 2 protein [Candidatus Omnitrophota bacterium]